MANLHGFGSLLTSFLSPNWCHVNWLLIEHKVVQKNKELISEQATAINIIANITEHRDSDTGKHTQRTQRFVEMMLREMAKLPKYKYTLGEDAISIITRAAPLHDIGKVGIPDEVLLKPGRLTPEEFEIIKKHPAIGEDALSNHAGTGEFFSFASKIAGYHQEKWDGSGYPCGIAGELTPLSARAMALADVYDALIMKRVYKDPMSPDAAKAIIEDGRGTHFDPILVDIFLAKEAEFIRVSQELAD